MFKPKEHICLRGHGLGKPLQPCTQSHLGQYPEMDISADALEVQRTTRRRLKEMSAACVWIPAPSTEVAALKTDAARAYIEPQAVDDV